MAIRRWFIGEVKYPLCLVLLSFQYHAGYRWPGLAQYKATVTVTIIFVQAFFNWFLYEAVRVSWCSAENWGATEVDAITRVVLPSWTFSTALENQSMYKIKQTLEWTPFEDTLVAHWDYREWVTSRGVKTMQLRLTLQSIRWRRWRNVRQLSTCRRNQVKFSAVDVVSSSVNTTTCP